MTEPTKFAESNALLYALSGADEDVHAALDTMTETELRDLYRSAERLSLTIWVRLGRPAVTFGILPIPDPRDAPEPKPDVASGGLVWFCAVCDRPRGSAKYAEPCDVCGSTYIPYLCRHCDGWHVGHRPKRSTS